MMAMKNIEETAFTITTSRKQRFRLEALKLKRAAKDGELPTLKELVGEALERFLAVEERTQAR